jgi:hypothetical protein
MASRRSYLCLLCLILLVLVTPATPISAQSGVQAGDPVTVLSPTQISYPLDPLSDIEWSAKQATWSDMVAAYNHGRERENELLGTSLAAITFPAAEVWAGMSNGEKSIWLINEERSARGLVPLQGLEEHVGAVAQGFAEWLLANNAFAHDADGRSPWERLDANPAIGNCHDFLGIAENLYFTGTSSPDPLPLVIEQALYAMLYDDAGSAWGHRHALLWTAFTENNDDPNREGFLGVGYVHGGFTSPFDSNYYQSSDIVVINLFDPCATWSQSTPGEPEPSPSPSPSPSPGSSPSPSPSPSPSVSPSPSPSASPSPTASPSPQPDETPIPPKSTPFVPGESRTASGRVSKLDDDGLTVQGRGGTFTNDFTNNDGHDDEGLEGVTLTSDSGQSAETDANGDFVLKGLSAGIHVLTPSKDGYSFNPALIMVDLSNDDRANISILGRSGPAGTRFSYNLRLPLILPAESQQNH